MLKLYEKQISRYTDIGSFGRERELLFGTCQDITERKRAEQALRNEKKFIDMAIDSLPGIFYLFTREGKLLRWNKNFERVSGYTAAEISTMHPRDFFPVEEQAIVEERIGEVFTDGESFVEANWLSKNGTKTLHYLTGVRVDIEGIPCQIGMGIDISERRLAEKILKESEERHASLVDAISRAGIFLFIVDKEYCVRYMNEPIIQSFGNAIGKTCYRDVGGSDSPCSYCQIEEVINNGKMIYYEPTAADGRTFAITAVPYTDVDGTLCKLEIIRDITESKLIEAHIQQAQKMEAIGTLAGGIAHDFNNLLMAIQGRTSIMLMKKDSSHPDIRHLKGIEDNVESAADLTRQLLGFARGGKYEVKPTDLNEVVNKQNRMFGRTKKEITIRGKYEENLWPVEADRGQIEQVLLNLYVNAWQAMLAGGDLYLETENVTLDENYVKPFSIKPGKYVKISVTDTGTGMDKATQKKIFEPFFTTKEMGRGTGLGLASAYGIIKNHGGFISVYSEKGHGTTFNIYLPASEKEIIEEKKPTGDTLRGTETVLFVDDEEMIIEVAEEIFEQLGYKVLIARSGKEAIEIYEENKEHIDIVLLDMIMPDMSGSDTYDKMKKIDPDIKVLLSSGYSINGQATEIMDRGCNGFIQKPFKMKELSQKLREVLDKK